MLNKLLDKLMSSLAGKIFDFMKTPGMIIVMVATVVALGCYYLPSTDTIGSWFGVRSKAELKCDTEKLNTAIVQLKENNQALGKDNKRLQGMIETLGKIEEERREETQVAVTKKERSVQKVSKVVERIEKSNLPEVEKDRAISQERIVSMWTLYCEYNIDSTECTETSKEKDHEKTI